VVTEFRAVRFWGGVPPFHRTDGTRWGRPHGRSRALRLFFFVHGGMPGTCRRLVLFLFFPPPFVTAEEDSGPTKGSGAQSCPWRWARFSPASPLRVGMEEKK